MVKQSKSRDGLVVFGTQSTGVRFVFAESTPCWSVTFAVMMSCVHRLREKFKVLQSVVGLITVNVMNDLITSQQSTEVLFHDEPVFKFPFTRSDIGSDVSIRCLRSSALPHRMVGSVLKTLFPIKTWLRATWLWTCDLALVFLKGLLTNWTGVGFKHRGAFYHNVNAEDFEKWPT